MKLKLANEELRVFALDFCGLTEAQIARRLGKSIHTVRHQRASISRKLRARDAAPTAMWPARLRRARMAVR